MITRRTKLQLLVFAIITVLGVSYVGARYARLDRVFFDDHYTVVAHLAESGGLFKGAEVTYRGVQVGRVGEMVLTSEGVDAHLDIDNDHDRIPAETEAVVGNRSAVGEQYIELQPTSDDAPYLEEDAEIAQPDTTTPIATEELLGNLSRTVSSVDRDALRTTVHELGVAFGGTGPDLQRIIDTSTSFIDTADENFQVTTDLIRDSNTVLNGQVASESAIRNFASQLELFSTTLAQSDGDLRRVIDTGSGAAAELRTFLEENQVELGELIGNMVTTGEITVRYLDGLEGILIVYPYIVEGGMTVVAKSPDTGLYDAHFGMIMTDKPVCHRGYESTDRRPPQDGSNRPMNERAHCAEPPTHTNSRGAHTAPANPRVGTIYDSPVVASYDPETDKLTWGGVPDRSLARAGTVAPRTLGKESWKWLFLQPLTTAQE